MPKFHITLKSQTDDQRRHLTFTAPTKDAAVAHALACEVPYVEYSLETDPYMNEQLAEHILANYHLLDSGKVSPGHKIERAKYHLHHQKLPYVVESVEPVEFDVKRLVLELAQLQHDPKQWQRLLDEIKDQGLPFAAVTAGLYGLPIQYQYDGSAVIDWDTNTIKCSLHTAYTFNNDTHDFFNDVSGTEVAATGGYTAGGTTLTASAPSYDTASDQIRLDATDASWSSSTISATDAIVYKSTGTASTSPLVAAVDFGGTVSTTSGTFQITWDTTGIVVIDVT